MSEDPTECSEIGMLLDLNAGDAQVEVRKFKDGRADEAAVIRSCIAKVPPSYDRIEVSQLSDSIWGSDGWNT
jgi:hypothetical protein